MLSGGLKISSVRRIINGIKKPNTESFDDILNNLTINDDSLNEPFNDSLNEQNTKQNTEQNKKNKKSKINLWDAPNINIENAVITRMYNIDSNYKELMQYVVNTTDIYESKKSKNKSLTNIQLTNIQQINTQQINTRQTKNDEDSDKDCDEDSDEDCNKDYDEDCNKEENNTEENDIKDLNKNIKIGISNSINNSVCYAKYYGIKYMVKLYKIEYKKPRILKNAQNRMFLFHGTKNSNVFSIINNGFNTSKTSSGRMLGDGVYFANISCKSLGYTDTNIKSLFICEVGLENVLVDTKIVTGKSKTTSVYVDGTHNLDTSKSVNINGVKMPFNPHIQYNKDIMLRMPEYCIYDCEKIIPRYLVVFKNVNIIKNKNKDKK